MLGDKIRFLRKKKKMTLKELGAKVDSTESAMSLYETNKRTPEYELLKKIASVFKVPCAYFLEEGIFSKIEWIQENYKYIFDVLIESFGDRFNEGYELTKDLTPDEKALALSSIIYAIEIDDTGDTTEVNFHYYIDSPSYDDLFDLPAIYKERFSIQQFSDEQAILDLQDFTSNEREEIRQFAEFIKQKRGKKEK